MIGLDSLQRLPEDIENGGHKQTDKQEFVRYRRTLESLLIACAGQMGVTLSLLPTKKHGSLMDSRMGARVFCTHEQSNLKPNVAP